MSRTRTGLTSEAWRVEADPEAALTPRQRQVLQAVRSTNGNRARAARLLRVSTANVQRSMRRCREAGVAVPPPLPSRRGQPNLGPVPPRARGPRCEMLTVRLGLPCARPLGHSGQDHRTAESVRRAGDWGRYPRTPRPSRWVAA